MKQISIPVFYEDQSIGVRRGQESGTDQIGEFRVLLKNCIVLPS